jgi:hypothetical protein
MRLTTLVLIDVERRATYYEAANSESNRCDCPTTQLHWQTGGSAEGFLGDKKKRADDPVGSTQISSARPKPKTQRVIEGKGSTVKSLATSQRLEKRERLDSIPREWLESLRERLPTKPTSTKHRNKLLSVVELRINTESSLRLVGRCYGESR